MSRIPKLRFPGFYEEWKENTIGEIFNFYTTNSYSRDCLNDDTGTVKNIHYGDIHMKFPTILDVNNSHIPYINHEIDLNKISKDSYCKEGDIVIADASEDYADIGKTIEIRNIGNEKIVSGLHTVLGRDNKGITENGYRGYMFLNDKVRKQIKILAVGSKVLGISKPNINKILVYLPQNKEQQKIARFFSLIDKKIQKQQEKVEALKDYKKSMMQNIFSQEIRFKRDNGDEYPEWEEKTLSEVSNYASSNVSMISLEEFNGDNIYPIYNANQIYMYIDKFDSKEPYISIIKDGAGVGRLFLCEPKSSVIGTMGYIKASNNCLLGFLYYRLQLINFAKFVNGSTIPHVYYKDYKNVVLYLPSLEEQQKITNILCCLDKKLNKEQEKLESLNQWKWGLLQQMFV